MRARLLGREPDGGEEERLRAARLRMVDRQLRRRGIRDPCVLAAMAEIPRERFVGPDMRSHAYRDRALPIGEGQTISQPYIVAKMADLLELHGDERVLEVGTGSGYAAAVLARCCREVVTVERRAGLARRAEAVLEQLGVTNVEVRVGDGTRGVPELAPFGGVSVAAAAKGRPPPALFDQLAAGAAMVCPVEDERGEHLVRFRGTVAEMTVPVRFVPLIPSVERDDGPA
jgi:protein-L-isoaspartate(D-aspartate) O-methyltransferase